MPKKRTSTTTSLPRSGSATKSKRWIIGLTGRNAAGKGEVARILGRLGYRYRSLSDILRQEASRRGLNPSRETLIRLGQELRKAGGPGVLAERTVARLGGGTYVVDSIRNPTEIDRLAAAGTFLLLAVDAPIEIRYARAAARGRDEGAGSLEEFRAMEEKEHSARNPAQQLDLCFARADEVLVNAGSVPDLERMAARIVKKRNFPIPGRLTGGRSRPRRNTTLRSTR